MFNFLGSSLWKSRFIVLLAVVFGFVGAVLLFIVASMDIISVATYVIKTIITGAHPEHFHEDIVAGIIGAVDLYLIAIVMLIFSFGIYELFISKIDAVCNIEKENCDTILSITSLDQLKDKIAKVIIMVLVVNYFQRVLHTTYETPLELLYFALAITALAVGLYFLGKVGKKG
ncbi:YqhA family protein [Arcobacter sp. FWKO B]|uniref:YqhA family protein n=1 Tax=Arcobacter sp. FWKO B TaxID=2593672 RepID=UPI0018A5521A|nr:YqhA family protein [Arcobacter sp. FWKO B]QOG11419.1 YqhA family protein [Arcobacter sp. FWKO B]